jgi:hypothetical protein
MAVLIAVEWPFASFLMNPAARNWLFHPANFPYFAPPESASVRFAFRQMDDSAVQFWRNIGLAFTSAFLSMWVGIVFGNWLRRVRR